MSMKNVKCLIVLCYNVYYILYTNHYFNIFNNILISLISISIIFNIYLKLKIINCLKGNRYFN